MHCLLVEQIYWSNGDTVIFQRPDDDTSEEDVEQSPLTQLEWCIHRLLTEIGDISRTVEYWSRDEFMNIPAHVDIDENQFNDNISISCISSGSSGYTNDDMASREIFCPTTSHVLYLDVQEDVRGPTCIFPGKQGGWTKSLATPNNKSVDLVTVPAVPGQFLQFPGNTMHVVPCPTERWLMTDKDEEALQQNEKDEEEERDDDGEDEYVTAEEEWDNDEDEDDDEDDYVVERPDLLFNTWPDDGPPPRGVSVDEGDTSMEDWKEDYGVNAERISCDPGIDWKHQGIVKTRKQKDEDQAATNSNTATIWVNLMGPPEWRIHKETTARLQQPWADQLKNLQDGLQHKTEVTH